MLKLVFALSLVVQIGMLGCAFSKKPKDDGKSPQTMDALDQLQDQDLKIQIVETPTFNEYFVKFSWPSAKKVRVELSEAGKIVSTELENRTQIPIRGGTTRTFLVTVYNSIGGNIFKKDVTVTAPVDMEILEDFKIERSESYKLNRLYVGPSKSIILNGNNLTIEADRINFSIDSKIQTGGQIQASTPEQLLGSKIDIKTRIATGRLTVWLDGFHGRDGRSGDEIDQENGFVDSPAPELQGTPAGEGKVNSTRHSDAECRAMGANGGPGKPGAQGTSGENGQNGGNSGSFNLIVDSVRQSDLIVEVIPTLGEPGKGGAGGIGRAGGPGGPANKSMCGGQAGAQGPRGPSGKNGENGHKGSLGSISVTPGIELKVR